MLYEEIADPGATTPDELRREYEAELGRIVDGVGLDAATEETGVDRARLAALRDGESPQLTVAEAAAIVGLSGDWPDAETVRAEVRDGLMLGMSSAVLDVDALADGLDGDLGPREIQQKIEGRQEMTLAEYAAVRHLIAIRRVD